MVHVRKGVGVQDVVIFVKDIDKSHEEYLSSPPTILTQSGLLSQALGNHPPFIESKNFSQNFTFTQGPSFLLLTEVIPIRDSRPSLNCQQVRPPQHLQIASAFT